MLEERPADRAAPGRHPCATGRRAGTPRASFDAGAGRRRHIVTLDEEDDMGSDDKIANKGEGMLGKAKEALGDATDNKSLQAEGKNDQSKADLKDAGEKIKDAFNK
jgi:uncharacterized protein YjbJ (UPF0337 family)